MTDRGMIEVGGSIIEQLEPLFYPKSVAVIGASNNPTKWGFSIFNDLLVKGFKGALYPINRNEEKISGIPCYKGVKDIPKPVDLAVIAVPAEIVPTIMKECAEKDVKTAVIISAGFGDAGEEGERLEKEVVRIARQGGIRFVGPNCFGIINPFSNLSTTGLMSLYITPYIPKGSVAVITQSGNLGTFILKLAFERGFGISKFVNSGNEADLHVAKALLRCLNGRARRFDVATDAAEYVYFPNRVQAGLIQVLFTRRCPAVCSKPRPLVVD